MRRIVTALAALALSSGLALSAQAATLTWVLQDFTFDDGGTAQGSFDFDPVSNVYSNVNVTTSGGDLPGVTYSATTSLALADRFDFVPTALGDLSGSRNLFVLLQGAMTAMGGTIDVFIATSGIASTEGLCTGSTCTGLEVERRLTGGSITGTPTPLPIPLPGALPLMAGGLALLGLAGWRRRRG